MSRNADKTTSPSSSQATGRSPRERVKSKLRSLGLPGAIIGVAMTCAACDPPPEDYVADAGPDGGPNNNRDGGATSSTGTSMAPDSGAVSGSSGSNGTSG